MWVGSSKSNVHVFGAKLQALRLWNKPCQRRDFPDLVKNWLDLIKGRRLPVQRSVHPPSKPPSHFPLKAVHPSYQLASSSAFQPRFNHAGIRRKRLASDLGSRDLLTARTWRLLSSGQASHIWFRLQRRRRDPYPPKEDSSSAYSYLAAAAALHSRSLKPQTTLRSTLPKHRLLVSTPRYTLCVRLSYGPHTYMPNVRCRVSLSSMFPPTSPTRAQRSDGSPPPHPSAVLRRRDRCAD